MSYVSPEILISNANRFRILSAVSWIGRSFYVKARIEMLKRVALNLEPILAMLWRDNFDKPWNPRNSWDFFLGDALRNRHAPLKRNQGGSFDGDVKNGNEFPSTRVREIILGTVKTCILRPAALS